MPNVISPRVSWIVRISSVVSISRTRPGFAGPYTLIYDGPNENEWSHLAQEAEVVLPYLARET